MRRLLKQRVIARVQGGYITNIDHNASKTEPSQQVTKEECERSDDGDEQNDVVEASVTSTANVVSFEDFIACRANADDDDGVLH